MDIIGPVSFLTDLISKLAGAWSNRPRLGVKIMAFRPDSPGNRLVFRASVLNYGRAAAGDCEGFWTIFDPSLREVSSGRGVFWSPATDDDYDFQNRECTSATIEYNERRFCWAELDVTSLLVERTNIHLFPYDCREGMYTFALVVEYGQYKSFDFIGVEVPKRILGSVAVEDAIKMLELHWNHGRGIRGLVRSQRLSKFVAKTDYHNYIRPT